MDPAHVPYAHYGLMRVGKPKGNFDKICISKLFYLILPLFRKYASFRIFCNSLFPTIFLTNKISVTNLSFLQV